jgi:hypothetical protein
MRMGLRHTLDWYNGAGVPVTKTQNSKQDRENIGNEKGQADKKY